MARAHFALLAAVMRTTNGCRKIASSRTCEDEWQLRVEANGGDVVSVALQRLDARLGLVIPHLH